MRVIPVRLLCVLLVVNSLLGCGAVEKAREAAKRQQMMNNLKMLGLAYHQCHDANKRGPLNWQEAEQNGLPAEISQLLQGAGYTVHWGITMADAAGGTSLFVLAYPGDASTAGGPILMLDGAVMHMTAQEFNDALAKQKVDSPAAMAAATGGGATGGDAAAPPTEGAAPPGPPMP